jgi:hypothetical protein
MACCSADVVSYALSAIWNGTVTGSASWGTAGGCILTPPAFYTSFDLEVVCVWASIDWFFLSSHFDGLADGRKRFSDSLNFDLMSIAVVTCPAPKNAHKKFAKVRSTAIRRVNEPGTTAFLFNRFCRSFTVVEVAFSIALASCSLLQFRRLLLLPSNTARAPSSLLSHCEYHHPP